MFVYLKCFCTYNIIELQYAALLRIRRLIKLLFNKFKRFYFVIYF